MYKICCFLVLLFVASACQIGIPRSYKMFPTEIFFKEDVPQRPFQEIEYVYLSDEREYYENKNLRQDLLQKYGQLPKGYSYEEKELLLYQLSKQAREIGADAIIQVEYQLYIRKDVYGYNLKALAVRYIKENY